MVVVYAWDRVKVKRFLLITAGVFTYDAVSILYGKTSNGGDENNRVLLYTVALMDHACLTIELSGESTRRRARRTP